MGLFGAITRPITKKGGIVRKEEIDPKGKADPKSVLELVEK